MAANTVAQGEPIVAQLLVAVSEAPEHVVTLLVTHAVPLPDTIVVADGTHAFPVTYIPTRIVPVAPLTVKFVPDPLPVKVDLSLPRLLET